VSVVSKREDRKLKGGGSPPGHRAKATVALFIPNMRTQNPAWWYQAPEIKTKYPFIEHGEDCFIARSAYVDHRAPIKMGHDVTICDWVKILTHDYSPVFKGKEEKVGGLEIGNNVFIGIQSIILPGIKIGDNVIVGAGSVVTKDLPSNATYAGNPAKEISNTRTETRPDQINENSANR